MLPQALRVTIPALVNTFIALFKDTSLVAVIGLFDLLGAAKAVIVDPRWVGFGVEVYLFVAGVYFVFCFAVSQLQPASRAHADGANVITDRQPSGTSEADIMLHVDMQGVNKWFGAFHVLRDITLKVARGERIVICGPSGSGKSTLIRCINRLEAHQKGRIVVDGTELTDDLKKIDEVRRDVGMVFQQFNLFPHLTILENCTLAPIWVKKMPKRDARGGGHALSPPRQDPGAGRQVSGPALGRTAAARGDCPLALHEPEDHAVRRADLGARPGDGQGGARHHGLARREGMTMLCVTHEMGFARQVADRVVFMDAGQIVEVDEPDAFFDIPQHERTQAFLSQVLH